LVTQACDEQPSECNASNRSLSQQNVDLSAGERDKFHRSVGTTCGGTTRTIDDRHVPKDAGAGHVAKDTIFTVAIFSQYSDISTHQKVEILAWLAFAAQDGSVWQLFAVTLG
jgi:hypothetical protein